MQKIKQWLQQVSDATRLKLNLLLLVLFTFDFGYSLCRLIYQNYSVLNLLNVILLGILVGFSCLDIVKQVLKKG